MTSRLMPRTLGIVAALCLVPSASAQYNTGFETVTASASGTALNGQDNFFTPTAPSASITFNAYTYAGNTLKIATNPQGGKQFVAGTGPATVNTVLTYARSERNIIFVGDKYTAAFDILVLFTGTGTPVDNIGSFSTQGYNTPATHKAYISLARWATAGSTWKVSMVFDNGAGLAVPTTDVPGTGFTNLPLNTWYRWETDFCLKTNQILEIRLTDIAKKTTVKHRPSGWYVQGGINSTLTTPVGYRLFAGSSVAGNTLCFDNVTTTLTAGAAIAQNYGGGSSRLNPSGSLVITGTPVVGGTMKLGVHNPLATQKAGGPTLLALALTKNDPGLSLVGFGMRRGNGVGELLVSNLVLAFGLSPWDGNKPSELPIMVPNDCTLTGLKAYFQGIIGDKGLSTAGLTEAAELTIGTR